MARMNKSVAFVVGGATGIGRATAERLATEGATVFLTGRSSAAVTEAAAAIGHGARGIVADAGSPDDLARAIATVRGACDHIDALVLNAGISEPAALEQTDAAHFDRHFALNVRGPVLRASNSG